MKKHAETKFREIMKVAFHCSLCYRKDKICKHTTDLPTYCLFNLPKQKTENARIFGITKKAHRVTDCCEWLFRVLCC